MAEDGHIPRFADKLLDEKLAHARAVVIRGPKWCGKTMTAEQRARSALYVQNPDDRPRIMATMQVRPSLLLEGEKPQGSAATTLEEMAFLVCRGGWPDAVVDSSNRNDSVRWPK